MNKTFQFGQHHPDYAVRVLNERAVRASAGILFFMGLIAFMNAWLVGNFQPTRVFVLLFLLDFSIRVFVNPLYAPSLIIGQWFVRKQQPEYVGAPQKRFAWAIGFVLALVMSYLMVFNKMVGPLNLLVCGICLALMFAETAFGICIGCKIYNAFNREKAQLCPGGVCDVQTQTSASVSWVQALVVLIFVGIAVAVVQAVYHPGAAVSGALTATPAAQVLPASNAESERCKVPEFAKAIGHEAKWKLHNNC
ncbi:MAG: DUF4395 domain-containing protein [Polaromonas sp.]|nr:DUF4395 domain-containing protein [Polaromonas sp.]